MCFAAFYYGSVDWKQAIFVDECCFSSEKDGIKSVKRPVGKRYEPEYINHSDHCARQIVSVWGACTYNGLASLIELDGRLNGATYAEILDTYAIEIIKNNFGNNQCYWVEDNCPAHRSELVKAWFESSHLVDIHDVNVKLISLPPYSPDLNLIENVWGHMKYDLLYLDETPRTKERMKQLIFENWEEKKGILNYTQAFYDSYDERLDAVLRNDGYPITENFTGYSLKIYP